MLKIKSLVLVAAALSLTACGSSLQFVKRAQPSAIAGASKIHLQELTYDGLKIGSKAEEQYLSEKRSKAEAKGKAEKGDDFVDKWEDNKQVWRGDMKNIISATVKAAGIDTESFAASAVPSEGIVVTVNIEAIEPGFYVGVASRPSNTQARVKIYDAAKPDVLLYEFTTAAQHSGFSTGGRVREDMLELANRIGDFIASEAQAK